MRTVLATALIVLALTGCAQSPDLRSVTYEKLGPEVVLTLPRVPVPYATSRAWQQNAFFGLPGTVIRPNRVVAEKDASGQRVAVWRILGAEQCEPIPGTVTLANFGPEPLPDIVLDYVLDKGLNLLPTDDTDEQSAKQDFPTLGANDFRRLRRITIHLTGLRAYKADAATLDQLLGALKLRDSCLRNTFGRGNAHQIVAAYAAKLDLSVEKYDGVSLDLGFLKARVEQGFRYRFEGPKGRSMFFAVVTRPVSAAP
jgi:hypothetical protein